MPQNSQSKNIQDEIKNQFEFDKKNENFSYILQLLFFLSAFSLFDEANMRGCGVDVKRFNLMSYTALLFVTTAKNYENR